MLQSVFAEPCQLYVFWMYLCTGRAVLTTVESSILLVMSGYENKASSAQMRFLFFNMSRAANITVYATTTVSL